MEPVNAVGRELNALFYPQIVCLDEDVLKYLLLLYDRVYYLPNDVQLNPGYTTIAKRFSINDSALFAAFGTREDAHYSLLYGSEPVSWDDPLKRLMDDYEMLEARGICVPLQDEAFSDPRRSHPLQPVVHADLQQRPFVEHCHRHRNQRLFVPQIPGIGRIKGGGIMMRPPEVSGDLALAALCSERINSTLYLAEAHNLVPVSDQSAFVGLYNMKVQHAAASPELAARRMGWESRERKARLGLLSWQIATEVVPVEALRRRSVDDVLRYRQEAAQASARFKEHLFRLEVMLTKEAWDEGFAREIEQIIRTQVLPEAEGLRESKKRIWEKLFNESLKGLVSGASLKVLLPLLTLSFVPGLSYLDVLVYGTVAAKAAEALLPKLLDARQQEAEMRRNALFFLVELSKGGRAS